MEKSKIDKLYYELYEKNMQIAHLAKHILQFQEEIRAIKKMY